METLTAAQDPLAQPATDLVLLDHSLPDRLLWGVLANHSALSAGRQSNNPAYSRNGFAPRNGPLTLSLSRTGERGSKIGPSPGYPLSVGEGTQGYLVRVTQKFMKNSGLMFLLRS